MQTIGMKGSSPQFNLSGLTPGQKALFYSKREMALIVDKQFQPGYGVLKAGTVMAKGTVSGKLVPTAPTLHTSTGSERTYVVASLATSATTASVTLADSYRFAVGDSLILCRDNAGSPAYHDGGAISAIDRTTYTHMAVITFTTAAPDANFTIANKANVYVKAGTSGRYSTAASILDQDIDTGTGSGAAGAIASVVLSNAILNTNALVNYDAAGATALGAYSDDNHVILK